MPGDAAQLPHDVHERALVAEDLLYCQSAYRQDERGFADGHLGGDEGFAAGDLLRGRAPVASTLGLAREAPGDGGHVDPLAKLSLGGAGRLFEPAKEGAPRRPGERAAKATFARAGRLAEQEDPTHDR